MKVWEQFKIEDLEYCLEFLQQSRVINYSSFVMRVVFVGQPKVIIWWQSHMEVFDSQQQASHPVNI